MVSHADEFPGKREARWLVVLRWIAVLVVGAAIMVARGFEIAHIPDEAIYILGAMALTNVAALLAIARTTSEAFSKIATPLLFAQLILDYVFLYSFLHYTHLTLTPIAELSAFFASLGAMFFSRRTAWLAGFIGVILYESLLWYEAGNLWRGDVFSGEDHDDPMHYAIHGVVVALSVLGNVYIVQGLRRVMERMNKILLDGEKISHSRERLTRIGELAAGVAHAVRNPLHGALTCTDLLTDESGCDTENTLKYLSDLKESLLRIQRVSDCLLGLHHEKLECASTSLHDIFSDAVAIVNSEAKNKNISIRSNIERDVYVCVDSRHIIEAIVNILNNAIYATPSGGTIISSAKPSGESGLIEIEVADSGPGFSESALRSAFDPFCSEKPAGVGTGIGLTFVKRIVEDHLGEVFIENVDPHGAMVRILLPITGPC
ncbi:MAG: HAMP domain-containing histidine kinase [Planctomycetes bacterium]|nr:HAMP domain-containing histidine kinase [Planctomycetota bacterium]